jgi:hypothetical protein
LQAGAVSPHGCAAEMHEQVDRSVVAQADPAGHEPPQVGASRLSVQPKPPRLVFVQSVRLVATASRARNSRPSSRLIVAASKSAHARKLPIVMRMPTGPRLPPDGRPVDAPRIRIALPLFNRNDDTVETPVGASLFTNL